VCRNEDADFKDDIVHVEDDAVEDNAEKPDADAKAFDAGAAAHHGSEVESVVEADPAAKNAGEVSGGKTGEDDELNVRKSARDVAEREAV
jgi:hypothetical protein